MKRVGIMSMQRIFNYGSTLQAYSLRRLIEDIDPQALVTFVDYRPGTPLVDDPETPTPSGLKRTLSKIREYGQVDGSWIDRARFLNHKRRYGRKYLAILGLSTPSYDANLDLQVIGSDEVFNCVQSNTRVGYSRDLFGNGSLARKIVSYAASFGNTTLERIDAFGIRDDLEKDLSRFAAISVRDQNSAEIIQSLTGVLPPIHVDPTLAHDLMNHEARIPQDRRFEPRYLVVYAYSGRLSQDENEALSAYAQRRNLKILCLGGVQAAGDSFIDCDPFELLAYFRDAEAVVTDTFHGTIFAIINNVPFGTIVRSSGDHGYGNEEKLGFLLKSFGLGSQRLTDLEQIDTVLDNAIAFDSVNDVIKRERSNSLAYLGECLS